MSQPRWTYQETINFLSLLVAFIRENLADFEKRGMGLVFLETVVEPAKALMVAAYKDQGQTQLRRTTATMDVEAARTLIQEKTAGFRRNIERHYGRTSKLAKAAGIGLVTGRPSDKEILRLGNAMVQFISDYPTEASSARVTQDDADEILNAMTAFDGSDNVQEGFKGGAVMSTSRKNAAHKALISVCDEIFGVAEMMYAGDKVKLEPVRRALPSRRKKPVQPAT